MIDAVLKRLRRKVEVMKLDAKARQDVLYQDVLELEALVGILERGLTEQGEGERSDGHEG